MKISIIGGGIAGLTAGIALRQFGFDATVYESAPILKPVGAGIVLAQNALTVYDYLGIGDALRSEGVELQNAQVTDHNAKPFQKSLDFITGYCIHRAKLHHVLYQTLGAEHVVLDKRLLKIEKKEKQSIAVFEDNTSIESDIIIGADGIHSASRPFVAPNITERFANQACWRGVCNFELPNFLNDRVVEMWGKKGRFGIVKVGKHQVYWFAVIKALPNGKDNLNTLHNYLIDTFSDFTPTVTELIKATPIEKIHRGDLSDLKPSNAKWHQDNICLIGDAAHATTPNMGQGACQAIEDAYTIALCLKKYSTPSVAFEKFQTIRKKKVDMVVKNSWFAGKLAHWQSPIAISFRNTMLKLTPPKVAFKQLEKVFDVSYWENI